VPVRPSPAGGPAPPDDVISPGVRPGCRRTAVQFYNLRTRARVEVPTSQLKKRRIERQSSKGTSVRYQLVAETDGARMFKFVDERTFSELDVPEVRG
jgi:hypothetical protein